MPRAPKKCAKDGCEERVVGRTYCVAHTPVNWPKMAAPRTGTAEHKAWRTAVLARDKGRCQIRGPRCVHRATEADHVVPWAAGGARYELSNGQAACVPCHREKTQREATQARRRASN